MLDNTSHGKEVNSLFSSFVTLCLQGQCEYSKIAIRDTSVVYWDGVNIQLYIEVTSMFHEYSKQLTAKNTKWVVCVHM
jgi:hypothetical protein